MKKEIIGFWGGSRAHKETVRKMELKELLQRLAPVASAPWKKLAYGTLADMR